jgi:CRISPR-associated exonuclease Cas4
MEYCPRRFYYQFVQGEMLVNEFVLEGTLEHQRVHQAGSHRTGVEEIETTRMYLYSEALGVSGFTDVIQERGRVLVPVEYKHGHLGEWINDHVQLCAQAMCLEERMAHRHEKGQTLAPTRLANDASASTASQSGKTKGERSFQDIPYGYIFYVGSRRRVKVHFTEQLRARTRETIAKALKVATLNAPPPPLSGKMVERCPDCSLLPLCMPEEVRKLQSKKRT